ncbi:PH domain-containing protein [Amycolatopsis pittospori]|uniref:PH domain-containing protein n=1 Tax=Amycolatopsis pittospori TaxID=2749434 RepID=UPI0015F0A3E1|nr:PH domain-containing protein [Amycolatopsis pittospori]
MAEEKQQEQANEAPKAVFKIPNTALLAIAFLVVCVTPVAFGDVPYLQWLYVFPIALAVFVIRTRTTATAEGLEVRTMFGRRDLPWSSLKGLAITDKAKVQAVLQDDTKIALPAVRTRHLPVISLVSAGRMADPSGLTDSAEEAKEPAEQKAPEKTEGSGATSGE